MASKRENEEQIHGEEEQASEEQGDDSQRQCLLCGQVPESIICLTCGHNIDIPCATRVIIDSQVDDEPDISRIVCLICGVVTDLSQEVQAAIIAYGESEQEGGLEEGYEELGEEEEMANDQIEIAEEKRKEDNSFGRGGNAPYLKSSLTKSSKEANESIQKNKASK